MKKVLIITAHPSTKGFTHRIANAFKDGATSKGNEVEILDLYKTEHQIPFLSFEEKKDMMNLSPAVVAIQAKMNWADSVVWVHPLWWMGAPAIMKNMIDSVFMPHFAYKYTGPGQRVKLLKGKDAYVFITCDGSNLTYSLLGMPFRVIWQLCTLWFCGFKNKSFKVFDKSLFKTEEHRLKFLAKIKKIGERV